MTEKKNGVFFAQAIVTADKIGNTTSIEARIEIGVDTLSFSVLKLTESETSKLIIALEKSLRDLRDTQLLPSKLANNSVENMHLDIRCGVHRCSDL